MTQPFTTCTNPIHKREEAAYRLLTPSLKWERGHFSGLGKMVPLRPSNSDPVQDKICSCYFVILISRLFKSIWSHFVFFCCLHIQVYKYCTCTYLTLNTNKSPHFWRSQNEKLINELINKKCYHLVYIRQGTLYIFAWLGSKNKSWANSNHDK